MRGMKQEALGFEIGSNQKAISLIENSEHVDPEKLQQIADALGVPVNAIENFSDEGVINYFNNIHDNEFSNTQVAFGSGQQCTFNPLDKLLDAFDKNEKLYERLLLAEREKLAYLEKMLNNK